MKKLLSLCSILTVASGAVTNVVVYNNNNDKEKTNLMVDKIDILNKTDLNTITTLTGVDIVAHPNQTYQELITNINNFNEFKAKPLADGFKIKFYDQNNKEIANEQQELENITKIIVEIDSSLNDPNYQGTTKIDITKQLIILDQDMQNYFANQILPVASTMPPLSISKTTDKTAAVTNIISQLKNLQKQFKPIIKILLHGIYKEQIDFNKLRNENEVYDENYKPVPNDWFKNSATDKKANVQIYYGKTEKGFFFPIRVNII